MAGVREILRLFLYPDKMILLIHCVQLGKGGRLPDGLLDSKISMFPKVDGDATPWGQRPLCVLPEVYRLCDLRSGFVFGCPTQSTVLGRALCV